MRLGGSVVSVLSVCLSACIEYNPPLNLPNWPDSEAKPLEIAVQEDVILQTSTPIIDVLFTIDNSCSMKDEQDALAAAFPSFIDYFYGSGLDYHVGVVSTDLDNPLNAGILQGYDADANPATPDEPQFIDVNTPSPSEIFESMATLGTDGTGTEKGLGAIYLALEAFSDSFNAGFFREDASIHSVVISDEQDHTQETIISKLEFIEWYSGLKREYDDRTFSSIVHTTGTSKGEQYLDVTNAIGGITWDITNGDWAQVLDMLGVQATGLKREYFLSQLPVPGSIEVEVEDPVGNVLPFEEAIGDPPVGGWSYDRTRNSISFIEFMPESLSRVVIRYVLLSSLEQEDTAPVTLPE